MRHLRIDPCVDVRTHLLAIFSAKEHYVVDPHQEIFPPGWPSWDGRL
jgi:hypothetical protein